MSDINEKGSYAHGTLPGMSELFKTTEKSMTSDQVIELVKEITMSTHEFKHRYSNVFLVNLFSSLITTIESQKEEIEKWRRLYDQERQFSEKFQQERDEAIRKSVFWEDHCGNSELRIESLKSITELKNAEIESWKARCDRAEELLEGILHGSSHE